MKRKIIYNPESKENLNNRRIFGGNPDGMINFTRMKYQWALNLWDTMEANTWFPKETDMTGDKRDYMLLSPAELRMYDLVLAQLIFMDSLQTNNLMDNINPYITAPEVNACLSRQSYEEANHCFTEGTEILTSKGFIDFKDLTMEHEVANWCVDNTIFFEKPTEVIISNYDGKVIEFTGSAYSLEVTPNHRVVTQATRYENKLQIITADKVGLNNRIIPVNGKKTTGLKKLSFIDRLRIAYQADGCLVNNKTEKTENGFCYRFSFKKERKIDRMENMLQNADKDLIKFTKTVDDNGYTYFYVWVSIPMDKEFNWVNLEKISASWGSEFVNELRHWDGYENKKTTAIRYGNTNKKAIDKIIEVATLCGKIVGVETINPLTSKPSRIGKNKKTYYSLYIRNSLYKSGRAITKKEKDYQGKIYCCTVKSGMIIVKKNNFVTVTGNSKSYAVMVESISDNTDLIYDMWKTDDKLREKNTYIASVYEELSNGELTDTKLLLALFANQILEGIYFYAGFAAIYALGKSGKMLGSSQMIRFIQRDEVCLHPDTELLTSKGWVKIEDVTTDMLVAQMDLDTDTITFDNPLHKTWKKYDGEMYTITDARGNVIQNITTDHEIVLKHRRHYTPLGQHDKVRYYKNVKATLDNNLFNHTSWMMTSGSKNTGELNKLSWYHRLLIALQADGSIDKKRYGKFTKKQVFKFAFKKERKIKRFENILKNVKDSGVEYTMVKNNRGYASYYVTVPNTFEFDKNFDWVDLNNITTNWAREFMQELIEWDGHIAKDRNSLYFSNTNKKAFDTITCILSLAKYKFKTSIQKDDRKDTYKDVYRITWWEHTHLITTQNMKKESYMYKGNVGCVTMPKGTILTRLNGQVVVTGNCHLLLFQNMINSVRKERPELFTDELEVKVRDMFRKAVELEASWGMYITQGQILGFTDGIILQYIQYLADRRLEAVGYKPEYNVKHPMPWVDGYASFNEQRTNFFEGSVVNYSKGSLDFNDF